MDQNGKGWQLGGRYIMPLPTIVNYLHNILVGYDFKRTNNFANFSAALIFSNYIDIDQFLLGYDGSIAGKWGMFVCGTTFYFSPGGITRFNKDSAFAVERTGAKANYIYARATADAIIMMPLDFSWSISTLGQWASGKLLPSEQLSLGGYQTIRGYDENEIVSDRGLMIKNEFRSPVISFFKWLKARDELQFLVFCDFGYANDINQNILSKENKVLASVGPGLRYKWGDYVISRFDYGFQLDHISNRVFASGDHSRMHFSLIVGY